MESHSWEALERVLHGDDPAGLAALLDDLGPAEVARALSRLSEAEHKLLFSVVGPERSAEILETLAPVQAAGLVQELGPSEAAAILGGLPSHEQAQLLSEVEALGAEEILSEMPEDDAQMLRDLRSYDADEAGSLLVLEPLAFSARTTVSAVVAALRSGPKQISASDAFYLYALAAGRKLVGVVPLRRLLFGDPETKLSEVMIEPVVVDEHLDLDQVGLLFETHHFLILPVVDAKGRLLGTIERADVERELSERARESWLVTQGIVGGEELRSLPLSVRSRRRLSWLSVNVLLNLIAASVIALYQDTLASVLVLAVFLPIISDMSGCSGNQAVAVSLRELSLGLVRPVDLLFVLRKELGVGVLNGLALGLLLGGVAWLWQGSAYLGLVVGGALALNTVLAVALGGAVPLVLTRLGHDPALASGPILTTVTDMCGFFFALTFATALLSRLAV